MRWKKEHSRIIKRFPLLPIKIVSDVVWLEWCYIKQNRDPSGFWYNSDFATEERYLKYLEGSECAWAKLLLMLKQ